MENLFKANEYVKEQYHFSEKNKYVAMAFVPMQEWEELYDEETAFKLGTAFPSLNKPFAGRGKISLKPCKSKW